MFTKDRKGYRENQDELGTEVSKEDKANQYFEKIP
jgi:hypothetical protein